MMTEGKRDLFTVVGVLLAVAIAVAAAVGTFVTLANRVDTVEGQLASGGPSASLPIGSIIPYWLDGKPPEGWLECNGDTFDTQKYKKLSKLIGDRLPDLQGMFLRGAGQNSEQKYEYPGGKDRKPRTPQEYATARPKKAAFTTDGEPAHSHATGTYAFLKPNGDGSPFGVEEEAVRSTPQPTSFGSPGPCETRRVNRTDKQGGHSHNIMGGGDDETRPNNVAVRFLIKAR